MAQRRRPKRPVKFTRGSELLTTWRGERTPLECCTVLGINEAALHAFLAGRAAPGLKRAYRIQEATDGVVPVDSWCEPPLKKPVVGRAA